MSNLIEMSTCRSTVAEVASEVFRTMLELELLPKAEEVHESLSGLTATVQFLGELRGSVLIHCQEAQAIAFASRMLGEPLNHVNDDVRDVLAELANVVGGNLKSIFSPRGILSLPLVAEGENYVLHLSDASSSTTVGFDCEDGPFYITFTQAQN
jgi:chemotaxis protein CheX